ncbi:nucleotide disphospho-sugar-binding domain-containing protein [Pseudonocardia sp. HH130629-09]|uniref:nucleotide disphospho-sugar-binding domain-containing protein n=1 Tax=Pseudonocardia sp. HH130629-09 TaxID=1641402 RepID=UPI0006CB793B|nr:nucleotide disphospho-sugar-binding domain-containing protein [Pseudonocardia sp. HH130629-09]ALE82585.1 SelSV [Pseudonocardia sp. HH130629-09]
MRVLFAISSWTGHYFPMVPLAWAMRAAGHDVRVLCRPSDQADVTAAGLIPVPALDGLDLLRGARLLNVMSLLQGTWPYPQPPPHPDTGEAMDPAGFDIAAWHAENMPAMVASSRAGTDAAVAFGRSWAPDLVVHDQLSLEGPLVSAVTGAPSVLHLWGPAGTADAFAPVGGEQAGLPQDLSDAFTRYGAGTLSHDLADHVLDPCPPPLRTAVAGRDAGIRYVPYNGPGAAPLDLPEPDGRRPRVCVIWGRSVTRTFGPVVNRLPQAVRAAADLGAEVLLLARPEDARDAGPLPDGVRPFHEVPLSLVLPGCDAVVHYAGAGSVMTALTAGVPQLSVPCGFDQPMVAERLSATGAGLHVHNLDADAATLGGALEKLIGQPSYADAARDLAQRCAAMPSPAEVVADLEALAAR